MNAGRERWVLRVISGDDRAPQAVLLRGVLRIVEPFYASVMRARNVLYDVGVFAAHKLPRPTIAVGNLTTGGTGKTPLVQWLASQLSDRGLRPAILLRGYRSESTGGASDEQLLLADALGDRAIVVANPDRRAGAATALSQFSQFSQLPQPDLFILDDSFQHRRIARDLNILLISATNPFGYGHVLPRGLLREPISGLRRADAIVITRSNLVTSDVLGKIEQAVRRYSPRVPLLFAEHLHTSLRSSAGEVLPLDELLRRRFMLFTGIADPASLERQLRASYADSFAASRFFPDHHAFSNDDLRALCRAAAEVKAHALLTTEKDWVKIAPLATARDGLPILRLELQLRFRDDADRRLMEMVEQRLSAVTAATAASTPAGPANSSGAT